jgi:hypothetical protein
MLGAGGAALGSDRVFANAIVRQPNPPCFRKPNMHLLIVDAERPDVHRHQQHPHRRQQMILREAISAIGRS